MPRARRVPVDVPDPADGNGEQSDNDEESPDPENHDVSSVSSGQHSSKNSSCSSSSSSSDSDSDVHSADGPAPVGGDHAGGVPASVSPHPSVVAGSEVASTTGRRGGWTDRWGTHFSITMKGERGWECKCHLPHHPAERHGTTCSRTRSANKNISIDLVMRRLKWWALQGAALQNKVDHQHVPY